MTQPQCPHTPPGSPERESIPPQHSTEFITVYHPAALAQALEAADARGGRIIAVLHASPDDQDADTGLDVVLLAPGRADVLHFTPQEGDVFLGQMPPAQVLEAYRQRYDALAHLWR